MAESGKREPMLEMFLYESYQQIEQLEQTILEVERSGAMTLEQINQIFRVMHTIKGSSAMMMYDHITELAHVTEDLFHDLREHPERVGDPTDLTDLILSVSDAMKGAIRRIDRDEEERDDFGDLIRTVKAHVAAGKAASEGAAAPEGSVAANGADPAETVDESAGGKAAWNEADDRRTPAGSTEAPGEKPTEMPEDEGERRRGLSDSSERTDEKATHYEALLRVSEDCDMENIRCYSVIHTLKDRAEIFGYEPSDILVNHEESSAAIRRDGFAISFASTQTYEELADFLANSTYIGSVQLSGSPLLPTAAEEPADAEKASRAAGSRMADGSALPESAAAAETASPEETKIEPVASAPTHRKRPAAGQEGAPSPQSSFLSVNVEKMDKLMDLVGELVISEAMVTEHPELQGLPLDQFVKAARQLRKITGELQDVVMSIRMVPLTGTFQKMNRVVRDMSKKLSKEIAFRIVGQETEVDKSIIDQLADPLMHMIRNSVDHGIEPAEERTAAGKPPNGTVVLEAKNEGGEVWITIRDDGRGLDTGKILRKAKANGLLHKPEEEYTDREIFSLVFLPGFSTKEAVSEYSGRGVGMDVVNKNIQALGGTIHVESALGRGTAVIVKIPLTLAIIDGMTIKVGDSRFTIPTGSIRESFRVTDEDIIRDPDGNEMILIRNQCHKVLRLYERFALQSNARELADGIVLMAEYENEAVCVFADELLGKQQVVVKALPAILKKINGISGCTLLGDGNISLILDISGLLRQTG